jgi:3-dehydroquinate synthase
MADSCIGAKCGVNLGAYKNQLGFFQSPSRVAVWAGFLQTLPGDDVRSGFGEILKLSVTAGDEAFAWFENCLEVRGFEIAGVREAIERSLETKRAIIEEDEYEKNLRKTLNYGHTFGHALESVTENEIPHGLAVAWGVDVANYVAAEAGLLDPSLERRIHALISKHFSFRARHRYDASKLIAAMRRDKKAASGRVQLILPRGLGRLAIVPTAIDEELRSRVATYIERNDICSYSN